MDLDKVFVSDEDKDQSGADVQSKSQGEGEVAATSASTQSGVIDEQAADQCKDPEQQLSVSRITSPGAENLMDQPPSTSSQESGATNTNGSVSDPANDDSGLCTCGLDEQIPQQCLVCQQPAAGLHFGVFTCEGCKSFYGRTYRRPKTVGRCRLQNRCNISYNNRTSCKHCRLQRCYFVGMSRENSKYGRRSEKFNLSLRRLPCPVHGRVRKVPGAVPAAQPSPSGPSAQSAQAPVELKQEVTVDESNSHVIVVKERAPSGSVMFSQPPSSSGSAAQGREGSSGPMPRYETGTSSHLQVGPSGMQQASGPVAEPKQYPHTERSTVFDPLSLNCDLSEYGVLPTPPGRAGACPVPAATAALQQQQGAGGPQSLAAVRQPLFRAGFQPLPPPPGPWPYYSSFSSPLLGSNQPAHLLPANSRSQLLQDMIREDLMRLGGRPLSQWPELNQQRAGGTPFQYRQPGGAAAADLNQEELRRLLNINHSGSFTRPINGAAPFAGLNSAGQPSISVFRRNYRGDFLSVETGGSPYGSRLLSSLTPYPHGLVAILTQSRAEELRLDPAEYQRLLRAELAQRHQNTYPSQHYQPTGHSQPNTAYGTDQDMESSRPLDLSAAATSDEAPAAADAAAQPRAEASAAMAAQASQEEMPMDLSRPN